MNAVVLGCSHTAGVGVDTTECYVSLLSVHYNISIINYGLPGGNADHNIRVLTNLLRTTQPKFVISQWPNPFRRTVWHGEFAKDENIHNASDTFHSLLADSEENFMQPWLQNIVTADTMCNLAKVPIIHILLEDLESRYIKVLKDQGIHLNMDLKQPEQTWLFDSQGSDSQHHSARCHAQWAQRLIGLIDEHTK